MGICSARARYVHIHIHNTRIYIYMYTYIYICIIMLVYRLEKMIYPPKAAPAGSWSRLTELALCYLRLDTWDYLCQICLKIQGKNIKIPWFLLVYHHFPIQTGNFVEYAPILDKPVRVQKTCSRIKHVIQMQVTATIWIVCLHHSITFIFFPVCLIWVCYTEHVQYPKYSSFNNLY